MFQVFAAAETDRHGKMCSWFAHCGNVALRNIYQGSTTGRVGLYLYESHGLSVI